ncbi:hypothetical protein K438DRAFT_1756287 [Mycena galopus ATCC 62051]|nr:hypothetical protein K438DRAFT_1756287 [Mycena galopus ATCC 62051]
MATTPELLVQVKLPVELEREIFELSALSRPVTIPNLLLVAWHVNKWVEPILYRTIVFERAIEGYPTFTRDGLLRAIESKPASFFRDSVRNLNLTWDCGLRGPRFSHRDIEIILSACSGVVDLLVVQGFSLPDAIIMNSLPLKRLSVSLWRLFYRGPHDFFSRKPSVDFTQPIFSQLTHLYVCDFVQTDSDAETIAGLATLRRLTHLTIHAFRIFPVFHRILTSSTSLRILILLTEHKATSTTRGADENKPLLEDMRFVVMYCPSIHIDWQMGAHTGRDHWTRAEDFVAQRRLGIVNEWFIETDTDNDTTSDVSEYASDYGL